MLSVNDSIHGWSPIGGDDEDVNVAQDYFMTVIKPFSAPSNPLFSPICPPLDTKPKACLPQSKSTPLAPSTRVTHSSIARSSDRRAQRNRNRDPSWIPRPRNAFIIFRCDYSREHSHGSQESQDDDSTNPTVKTLSKRAAEAWKQLPPSEREQYKVLADKEREEHARLYPHYRFRPMKRQISGTRRTSRERSQGPRVPSVERPIDPLAEPQVPLGAVDYNNPLSSFSAVDMTHEDTDQAQALEAYAIGLYNYDLFSPFSFPEYY